MYTFKLIILLWSCHFFQSFSWLQSFICQLILRIIDVWEICKKFHFLFLDVSSLPTLNEISGKNSFCRPNFLVLWYWPFRKMKLFFECHSFTFCKSSCYSLLLGSPSFAGNNKGGLVRVSVRKGWGTAAELTYFLFFKWGLGTYDVLLSFCFAFQEAPNLGLSEIKFLLNKFGFLALFKSPFYLSCSICSTLMLKAALNYF